MHTLPGLETAPPTAESWKQSWLGAYPCDMPSSLPYPRVPLSALAPTCDAAVHHGGAGTTTNFLVAGVPQLVLPHAADQHANADSVRRRGVGLTFRPEEADAAAVRGSLERLLGDDGFAAAAADVRDEIAAQPTPAEIVPRLADLRVPAAG